MKPEITTVTYSTALTYELVNKYGFKLLGAPTFPSLANEAFYKADARTAVIPLFLQYKLGEYFVGHTASLIEYWGIPYYCFVVQPRTKLKNHELLLGLEKIGRLVYYTAPEFHTMNEFYSHLRSQTLLEKSTFWPPRAIGMFSENKKYTAAYKQNTDYGVLQPGNIRIDMLIRGKTLLDVLKHNLESDLFEFFDDEKLLQFGDQMLENFIKRFHSPKEQKLVNDILVGRARMDPRDYLSLISMLLYDCYVYMITAPFK